MDNTALKKDKFPQLSSAALHILAMLFMLCDHLWATVVPGNLWLTCVGRLAFPIFAFMAAEGYVRTGSLKKYILRLLIFAIISEIPFNLMYGSSIIYPYHQNVLWTFLLALGLIHLNKLAEKRHIALRVLIAAGTLLVGFLLGIIFMTDYNGAGVVTVMMFYFLRGRKWWNYLAQAAALYYINVHILGGLYFEVQLFGRTLEIVQQGIAVLALIPIWLYRGRQGIHSAPFRYFCYAFYPIHMLLLYIGTLFI